MSHPTQIRAGDAGNSTLPAAFGHIRAVFGPGIRARERAASITGAIAPVMLAARESVLSNTHGSVDFPLSVTACESRDSYVGPACVPRRTPSRIRHSPQTRPLGGGHSLPGPPPRGQRPLPLRPLIRLDRETLRFHNRGIASRGPSNRGGSSKEEEMRWQSCVGIQLVNWTRCRAI